MLSLTTYANFFLNPYLGFSINLNSGIISAVDPFLEEILQIDDTVIRVNGIPTEDINNSVLDNPFIQTKEGEFLTLSILRDGEEIEVILPKPPQSNRQLADMVFSDWILPIPFFSAGLITILFIRPRSKTRLLLILFFYSYAIWIGFGTISNTGYFHSPMLMRLFVWLSVPISLQLHWNFPKPFTPMKKWVNILGYGFFGVCVILEFINALPSNTYFTAFLFSIVSSIAILLIKFFKFKDIRKIMRSLLLAFFLALFPLLLMVVLSTLNIAPPKTNMALLGLTAIPGFYFFTAYQIHLNRKVRNINLAMRYYTFGICFEFLLNFMIFIIPPSEINPSLNNIIPFLMISFIMITGFGILLIMPALANDQVDLFNTESYTLRLSANRTAAFINFILFLVPIMLLTLLIFPIGVQQSLSNIIFYISFNTVFVGISILSYQSYKEWFERVVLGIKHPPEELIRNYARRITTSLDIHALAELLKVEVLPSLLIRESALFYFSGQSNIKNLFSTGVRLDEQSAIAFLGRSLCLPAETLQRNIHAEFPWVRFSLPLQIESDIFGVWLFGRKDPDDNYDQDLIKDLEVLGNQTTLALLNIRQGALLQALYQSNVDRQEAQKASVARDLHDVLLPSIGYLVELQSNNCDTLEFEDAVQRINDMVREIMSGLRPSSLDMGLNIALEELADEPEAQIGGRVKIHSDLTTPAEPIYYDKTLELHLYRMVQQACRNALEHAQASVIYIRGTLTDDQIDLSVEDDGVGFELDGLPDLGLLIINRHFGLANIVERAKIIHADVTIESKPNKGTRLNFYWPSRDNS
jgi:signal transduction histidine kinase